MRCDDIKPLLYLYREGELDDPEQQRLSEHLRECSLCRLELEQIHQMGESVCDLRMDLPEMTDPDRLQERIVREIRKKSRPPGLTSTQNWLDKILDWLSLSRVRFAMISVAVVIVAVFAIQEMMILSRINSLEQKIDSGSRNETMIAAPGAREMLRQLSDAGDANMGLPEDQLADLLQRYFRLQEENSILRELLEDRYPDIGRYLSEREITVEELRQLSRYLRNETDLL